MYGWTPNTPKGSRVSSAATASATCPRNPLAPPRVMPEALAVAEKAKRRSVMHDPYDGVLAQAVVGLAHVPTEHPAIVTFGLARNRYSASRSATEAIWSGKALARIHGRQRHNASQALVESRIAQRVAVEFANHVRHIKRDGSAHARIRSQTPPKKRSQMCRILAFQAVVLSIV